MRLVVWITAIFAALYSGYWLVGSRAALSGTRAALEEMRAEGRGDFAGVALHGFPSRFDITIDQPRLTGAGGQSGWSAGFLQIFALSYRPNHVIVVWPHEQTVTLAGRDYPLTATDLRASLAVEASAALPLDHAELEGHDLALSLGEAGGLDVEKLILAARRTEGQAASQDVALVATNLRPDATLAARLDPAGKLPPGADEVRATATLGFDRPVDRGALAEPLRLQSIRAISGDLGWGGLQLHISGDLTADAAGFAAGEVEIAATDWERLPAMAVALGLLAPGDQRTFGNMLRIMAGGRDGRLAVPLHFGDGMISVGPLYLGPAPRF